MWNVKFNHKTLFFTFKQRKINKPNQTVVKIYYLESLIYQFGGETANHKNFMQPTLVSYS